MLTLQDVQDFHRMELEAHYGEGHVTDHMVNRDVAKVLFHGAQAAAPGISKALTSDSNLAVAGTVGGEALKLEDLSPTLANAELNSEDHAPLWAYLKQVPCGSDVVEMSQLHSHGRSPGTGHLRLNATSGNLVARNPDLERKVTPVRWAGERWQTFEQLASQRTMQLNGDPIVGGAEKVNDGAAMEALLIGNNYKLWWGNYGVNTWEPNGLMKQVRGVYDASQVKKITRINMKGQPITPETLPVITKVLRARGAVWTDLWFSNQTQQDLEIMMMDIIRADIGKGRASLGLIPESQQVKAFGGRVGQSQFRMDLMLDPAYDRPDDGFEADEYAPAKPSSVTGAASGTGALNVWNEYLPAATYTYSVCSVGVNGRSDVCVITAPVAVNGAQKVVLTITNGADTAGDDAADYFEVYRAVSGGTRKYLGRVTAQGIANGATQTFVDDGEFEPGTTTAFAMANRPYGNGGSTWMNRMLHPISKVILPQDVLAKQAAYICGFTPQGLTLTHNVVIENIGAL